MELKIENLFSVKGKRILVTGGSSGIGYMIAEGFAANGASVVICARQADKCDKAADRISRLGDCRSLPADLTLRDERLRLRQYIANNFDELDVLINNAGIARNTDFESFSEEYYDRVMDTNFKATFFLTQGLIPLLRSAATQANPSRIINIGSNDGLRVPKPEQNGYAYGPSKAALHHLTRILALRYGPDNITVNAIAPGPFESEMLAPILERYRPFIEQTCPMRRIGKPCDMAGTAIFLASAAGSYVNGAVIAVDGGNTLG